MLFGISPSQHLLNATVRKHGANYEETDPEFARKVKDFYVDDLTTGVPSVKEGIDLYKKMKSRFEEAQFNIRKIPCMWRLITSLKRLEK